MDGRRPRSLWSLRDDAVLEDSEGGRVLVVRSAVGRVRLPSPHPLVRRALDRMMLGPISLENAVDAGRGAFEGPPGTDLLSALPVALAAALRPLQHLVVRSIGLDDVHGPVLSVVPVCRQARFRPVLPPLQGAVKLSCRSTLTVRGGTGELFSSAACHRVLLHRREALLTTRMLQRDVTPAQVSAGAVAPLLAQAIIAHVAGTGMINASPEGLALSPLCDPKTFDQFLPQWPD
ncbi:MULTISPECIES: hypothetical protein [unclassified Streptomyces]|uniref:hypothetical protein n=1 Tax=unclassified Streptomyces TaxID=2593676 RepID=UPI000851BCDC|nr:hypothetical protein [Streptomyces sp. LUP30]